MFHLCTVLDVRCEVDASPAENAPACSKLGIGTSTVPLLDGSATKTESSTMPLKIAIIGGGVIGLATGIRLQKAVPHIHLQIIAELLGDDTTSRGAGGLWKPFSLVE